MSTTLPAGVAAALGAGRVGGSYPYAPVQAEGTGGLRRGEYVTVPASVVFGAMQGRAKSVPVDEREYQRALVPLKSPSDAVDLARKLLNHHRAYGLTDTRDRLTAHDAHHAARSLLTEWRHSGRTTIHLTTAPATPPPMYHSSMPQGSPRIVQRTEIPPLPPKDHWMALQKEMQDLQDSLVQVESLVPQRPPAMRQGTWSKKAPSEDESIALLPPEQDVPEKEDPVPLDADGNPVQLDVTYYVADKMLRCLRCKVKMLATSRFCQHCATPVVQTCLACGEDTRCPAKLCLHCGQALPKEKRGRPEVYNPSAEDLMNPRENDLKVDLGLDEKNEKEEEKKNVKEEEEEEEVKEKDGLEAKNEEAKEAEEEMEEKKEEVEEKEKEEEKEEEEDTEEEETKKKKEKKEKKKKKKEKEEEEKEEETQEEEKEEEEEKEKKKKEKKEKKKKKEKEEEKKEESETGEEVKPAEEKFQPVEDKFTTKEPEKGSPASKKNTAVAIDNDEVDMDKF